MVIDLDTHAPRRNAPRLLWRNFVLSGVSGIDVLKDRTTWQSQIVPATITATLDKPTTCNAVGIDGGDWAGQTVAVDYNPTGAAWVQLGAWMPVNGAPVLLIFPYRTAPAWRIRIIGAPLTASVITFGQALAVENNVYQGMHPFTVNTTVLPGKQLGTHFTGRQLRAQRRKIDASFKYLHADWYRGMMGQCALDLRSVSTFFAWRPDDHPRDVVYGWNDGDIKMSNNGTHDFVSTGISITGPYL